jgi:phenylacetate-CoA ligase
MRRMGKVTARTDDMLIIRGVNLFPSQIEELIVAHPDLTPHYVLEVRREGSLDELTVKVEPRLAVADQAQACERAAAELGYRIKTFIGVTVSVLVCAPGAIERSVGKAKRVIDTRT